MTGWKRSDIFFAFLVVLGLISIPLVWAQYNVEPTKVVGRVVKKYVYLNEDSFDRYVVMDIDGVEQTFYVNNNIFAGSFKGAELYEGFTEGNWYRIDYLGERVDFFQIYPNVVDATPTGDPAK